MRCRQFGGALALAVILGALAGGCSSNPREAGPGSEAAAYNVQLGVAYLQQGNFGLAQEKLERALQQDPRSADVHTALALLHERLGNRDKVERHYRTALRLAPRDPQVSNNFAVYLCRSGRVEEGVERFLAAARNPLYRTPEAAYTNAGVCLRTAERFPAAEDAFRRALEVRPNFAEAAFQLGDLALAQGNAAQARTHLERYLVSFDPTPDLLLLGVRTARALDDRLAAERYARRLRLDFPDSAQARALAELDRNPG